MPAVSPAPVTAQLTMTSWFTPSSFARGLGPHHRRPRPARHAVEPVADERPEGPRTFHAAELVPRHVQYRIGGSRELVQQRPRRPVPDRRVLTAGQDERRPVERRPRPTGGAGRLQVRLETREERVVGPPVGGHVVSPDLVDHPALVHDQRVRHPLLVGREVLEDRGVLDEHADVGGVQGSVRRGDGGDEETGARQPVGDQPDQPDGEAAAVGAAGDRQPALRQHGVDEVAARSRASGLPSRATRGRGSTRGPGGRGRCAATRDARRRPARDRRACSPGPPTSRG